MKVVMKVFTALLVCCSKLANKIRKKLRRLWEEIKYWDGDLTTLQRSRFSGDGEGERERQNKTVSGGDGGGG